MMTDDVHGYLVCHAYYIQVVLNSPFFDIPSIIKFQIKCDSVLIILELTICLQNVFYFLMYTS
jgi:hypothetical protein